MDCPVAIGREGVDGPPSGWDRMDRRRCELGMGFGMAEAETCREEEPIGGLERGEDRIGDADSLALLLL